MACIYYLRLPNKEELRFDSKEALVEYIRKNNLTEELKANTREYKMETGDLAAVLRQSKFGEANFRPDTLREFQEKLLDEFIRLEDQSNYFFKMSSAIALTKGLGKSFDSIDGLKRNLGELGIDAEWNDKIPFDVRYLLTGDSQYKSENSTPYFHNITANNIRIAKEIDSLSRTMFMERTNSFQHTSAKVVANLKDGLIGDKVKEMQDELSAFAQVAAYKQWIAVNDKKTSTLRNSLIYDTEGNIPTIVDIVREAIELSPDNMFLQFVLPVSTVVKVGKRKQMNKAIARDLINTIEGKTRGKLEPDLISGMMDSFTELYQNPRTQFHAKALFDYLIVKDGLMFKNKSFIKLLPTIMFKEMSEATAIATRLMSANSEGEFKTILADLNKLEIYDKEGNEVEYFSEKERIDFRDALRAKDLMKVKNMMFQKVFGFNYGDLYNKYEQIYATDIRNQYNLELMRLRYKPSANAASRPIEAIKTPTEDGVKYVHVNLFNDKFKAMEKGSDERKKYFGELLGQLEQGGFPIRKNKDEDDNHVNLYFKKFMRVRESKGEDSYEYKTYRLVSVTRDGKIHTGAAMTEESELVPTGTYAVYAPVEPVGASNTTGVADLGARPTRVEILKTISSKIKRDDRGEAGATAVTPKDTPTPGTGGGILGSEESGASFTLPNEEAIQKGEGLQDQATQGLGDVFGQLGQAPYDPNTDSPFTDFNDDEVNEQPC